MIKFLDKIFKINKNQSSIKKELIAAFTTFLTMCYIIFVNPLIVSSSGMDINYLFISTCLITAFSSIFIGFFANVPLAIAPGMGLNALFAYGIVMQMGYSYKVALLLTSLSGVLVIIFSMLFIGKKGNLIPENIKHGVTAGIGMFVIMIGLENAKIIVDHPATLVTLGDLSNPQSVLIFVCFIILIVMDIKKIVFAPILVMGILISFAYFNGYSNATSDISSLNIKNIFFQFDNNFNYFDVGIMVIIVSIFIASYFDSFGTFISYSYFANKGSIDNKKLKKSLIANGFAGILAGIFGTSPTALFLESNSGVKAGGRTGLTAIFIGLMFLCCLLLLPLLKYIPIFVASPMLMFVGFSMLKSAKNIDFEDVTEFVPAVAALIFMAITYSILNGIALAFVMYGVLKIVTLRYKELSFMNVVFFIMFSFYLFVMK